MFSAISEWEELKEWICAAADKSLVEDALLKHNLLVGCFDASMGRRAGAAPATELLLLDAQVRSLLALHDGYEMEGEDGTFVVAFGSVYSAVKFASQVQTALLGVEWDADLVENPLAGEQYSRSGQLIFRGLRVKMGGARRRNRF